MRECQGCTHLKPLGNTGSRREHACHYLLTHGRSRECPPGKDCEKREEKKVKA